MVAIPTPFHPGVSNSEVADLQQSRRRLKVQVQLVSIPKVHGLCV